MSLELLVKKIAIVSALTLASCKGLEPSDYISVGANTALSTVPGLSLAQRAGLLAAGGLADAQTQHTLAKESAPNVTVNVNQTQPQTPFYSLNLENLGFLGINAEDIDMHGDDIIFSQNLGNNFEIFLIKRDGSGLRRMTYTSSERNHGTGIGGLYDERHPKWSPDGKRFAYDRNCRVQNFSCESFFIHNLETDKVEQYNVPGLEAIERVPHYMNPNAPTVNSPLYFFGVDGWNANNNSLFLTFQSCTTRLNFIYQVDLSTLVIQGDNLTERSKNSKVIPVNN